MDNLFGRKIVRFDDEDENNRRQDEASAERPRSSQPPFDTLRAGSALPPPVIAPQQDRSAGGADWQAVSASDAPPTSGKRWLEGLPGNILAMYDSAMKERTRAIAELHRLAQALSHDEWDGLLRAGKNPELWTPGQIADLVIRSVEKKLRSAQFSQDPALAENYQQTAGELSQAKADIDGLRQRLHSAETTVREMKDAALKEALRKQKYAEEKAQTGYVKQRVSSPPRAPVAAPRAAEPALSLSKGDVPPVVAVEDYSDGDEIITPEQSNERRDDVVRVLASGVACRAKDVRAALAKKWGLQNENGTQRQIKLAVKAGLIDIKQATLEWGGKPTGNMFVLTTQGRDFAKSLGVQIVRGQYEIGMALHKSVDHLYLILEIADLLRDDGYRDVDPFPPSMTLPGNKQYQPDIKARMPSPDNTIISIEVERNTYKATDRDDRSGKWLRAAEAGRSVIHLVTPSNEALTAIVTEIDGVRKKNPGQKMGVKAFSVSDFRTQKSAHGTGVVWVAQNWVGSSRE